MKRSFIFVLSALLVLAFSASACTTSASGGVNLASGTLSAVQVGVAPEISGRVVEIAVKEGDIVKKGDLLLKLDSQLLQAQYDQAKAASDAAAATVTAAEKQLVYVEKQLDAALYGARAQEMATRTQAWSQDTEKDYQPVWYFQKSEQLSALNSAVDLAEKELITRQSDLKSELEKLSNKDFLAVENRLNNAQAELTIANSTLDQAKKANNDELTSAAESLLDEAQVEFDSALMKYNSLLSSSAAEDLQKARADVAVAQARYDNAIDARSALETGSDSTQVAVARAAVEGAEAAITQAKANHAQAEAALSLIKLQLDKASVYATMDGTVMNRNIEEGELTAAGSVLLTIAKLDEMTLTVYIPENQYGAISLNQKINVKVDSFPNQRFSGVVTYIADQAEFTPRNVQNSESRSATVYAIKLQLDNRDGKLKPGMPADAEY